MRLSIVIVIILAVVSILTDGYILRNLRKNGKSKALRIVHIIFATVSFLTIVTVILIPHRSSGDALVVAKMWAFYTFMSIYVPKILFILTDLLAKTPKLFGHNKLRPVSIAGLVLAAVLFAAMWWGALVNRKCVSVTEQEVAVKNLPQAFDGYRLIQFSDLHLGTYGSDTTYVNRIVETINSLHPDLVVFTGDFVNRRAEEIKPFCSTLARISAPDGVYAIFGNHDYGDYVNWDSPEEKAANRTYFVEYLRDMGWKLLADETAYLRRGNDSIALIGVENIGDPPFPSYGSLSKAYADVSDSVTKILLTHNPAHWCTDIRNNPDANIALTLSGHTHAMQMELFGISPSALKYETWGGLYADSLARHLYVNIGIGTVLIPSRIGATPEITLITMHNS